MADQTVEVRFGGAQVDYLALFVRGRAYRHSVDYWDGNWLLVTAVIRVGKFSGDIPGMLRAEEIQRFTEQLQAFQQSLKGTVSFETAEKWLHFTIEADKLGHIGISGSIGDDVGSANRLTFRFVTDQTFFPAILKQLQTVAQTFPIVGKP